MRSRIAIIVRALVRSGFWMNVESGTCTSWMPRAASSFCAGVLNRSSQTTSLAMKRWVWAAIRWPAPGTIFFVDPSRWNAAASPARPLYRNCRDSIMCWLMSRSGPGGLIP